MHLKLLGILSSTLKVKFEEELNTVLINAVLNRIGLQFFGSIRYSMQLCSYCQ